MFNELLPPWIKNLEKSGIQKALHTATSPDLISFSLGRPDNQLLSLLSSPQLQEISSGLFTSENLQYSPPSYDLKNQIACLMKERGVVCRPEEILLTTGAQQAMTLLVKLFVCEGDTILVDQLTYPGFIQIAQARQAHLVPLPVCFGDGFDQEALENILKSNKRARLIYAIPEGHNPLGISLSQEKRIELVKLAEQYRIPIIEDDAYGFLNYDPVAPCLKSFGKEGVFYIGSFSKMIAPSLRVGWIVASEPFIEKLEILKEGLDINTSTLSQKFITTFLASNHFKTHLSALREYYKKKRDLMTQCLKQYISEMMFASPKSGFFIWGQLPSSINTNTLFKRALEEERVSFIPGNAFLIGKKQNIDHCLRLSFSFCPISLIETGIKKLAKAINA